jgi:hypothetical protein
MRGCGGECFNDVEGGVSGMGMLYYFGELIGFVGSI